MDEKRSQQRLANDCSSEADAIASRPPCACRRKRQFRLVEGIILVGAGLRVATIDPTTGECGLDGPCHANISRMRQRGERWVNRIGP
jgi:hypothetical protein